MIRILFFGTRSGTEPMEGMHHTSLAIEKDGIYYFFDAGENCAYTSYIMGVDHLKVKSIFISHPHMDHVGGLGGLIWNMRKLTRITPRRHIDKKVNLFLPKFDTWDGYLKVLRASEENFDSEFDIITGHVQDGLVYEDENIRVFAFHNHHMQLEEGDGWLSYSFLIEMDGKRIIFSGDIRSLDELDNIIEDGCDYLLLETGHHKIAKIEEYVSQRNIGKLILVHHGLELINNREQVEERIKNFSCPAVIAYDTMEEIVKN